MTRHLVAIACLFSIANLGLACGGSSESSFDDSADSTNGDGDGTSNSSGSGGSDGSNSDGSNSDGSNSDGSNSDGSNSDGSSSSGSGGSGDSGSGGSDASSGDSSTSSGSGGSGGTPANPVPSEEVVDACSDYCERKDEAGCENEETLQQCLEGCEVTTRVLDCEDELLNVLECSETADLSCNDSGEAEFSGCGVATLAWLSCVVTEGPDEDLLEPCETRCEAVQDADCPNDAGSEEDCILGCTIIGTILPECKALWETLLECGEGEEFVCNDEGQAQAPSAACGTEQALAWACVVLSVLE